MPGAWSILRKAASGGGFFGVGLFLPSIPQFCHAEIVHASHPCLLYHFSGHVVDYQAASASAVNGQPSSRGGYTEGNWLDSCLIEAAPSRPRCDDPTRSTAVFTRTETKQLINAGCHWLCQCFRRVGLISFDNPFVCHASIALLRKRPLPQKGRPKKERRPRVTLPPPDTL